MQNLPAFRVFFPFPPPHLLPPHLLPPHLLPPISCPSPLNCYSPTSNLHSLQVCVNLSSPQPTPPRYPCGQSRTSPGQNVALATLDGWQSSQPRPSVHCSDPLCRRRAKSLDWRVGHRYPAGRHVASIGLLLFASASYTLLPGRAAHGGVGGCQRDGGGGASRRSRGRRSRG